MNDVQGNCGNFEEHKMHRYVIELPTVYIENLEHAGIRDLSMNKYGLCDGVRKTDAEFLKWLEANIPTELYPWQKELLLKDVPLQLDVRRRIERGKQL